MLLVRGADGKKNVKVPRLYIEVLHGSAQGLQRHLRQQPERHHEALSVHPLPSA